jgi:formate dehydrogenase subunit beta
VTLLLGKLLAGGVVDAVLVPKRLPSGDGWAQVLAVDEAGLAGADPFPPTMPVQSARILSSLTTGEGVRRIAAVVRPCEARGAVELSKFNQVDLGKVLLVVADCPGTVEVADLAAAAKAGGDPLTVAEALLAGLSPEGPCLPAPLAVRPACAACSAPFAAGDIGIQMIGWGKEIGVMVSDELRAELTEKGILGFAGTEPAGRASAVEGITARNARAKEALLVEFDSWAAGAAGFLDRFSACVRCHNCMTACPICYCRECLFKTGVFAHDPESLLRWAGRKGGIRLPSDLFLFHTIRLAHMGTSCVGCGACESACPSGLPLTALFLAVGGKTQALFDYTPGMSAAEPPPVATFREDELEEKL